MNTGNSNHKIKSVEGMKLPDPLEANAALSTKTTCLDAWLMLNNSNLAAGIIDMNGIFRELNTEMALRFGHPIEELRHTPVSDYLPEEVFLGRKKLMEQAYETGLPQEYIDYRNGVWNLIHCRYLSSNESEVPLFVFTGLDITKQRMAEIEREKSDKLLLTTINSLKESIFVVDADCKIVLANDACIALLKEQNFTGDYKNMALEALFHFLDKSILDDYKTIVKTGESETVSTYFLLNDKETFVEIRRTPVYENGMVSRIVTTITDITPLKKHEIDLKATIATKDRFMSIIAHDLINPINSTSALAGILHKNYDTLSDEKKRYYARALSESLDRTGNLASNLLVWTRTQRGQLQANPTVFEISDLVAEVLTLLKPIADKKGLHFVVNSNLSGIKVSADYDMISTVLRNLISNAIKFTLAGGKVTVGLMQETPQFVHIEVTDTGVGIPEHNISKLLNPNEDYTTLGTESEKGTGVGLLLCQDLLLKHDSSLRIESEPGKGSTFSFMLKSAE